jgi:predicted signal transduction protein with EAL and GGDEF domain
VSVINQKTIIQNIVNSIAKIKVSNSDNLRLSISVGIALAPQDSRNAVDLIAHTNTALFHAKTKVSDRVCYFDACVQETLLHQFKLENDVRHIMERNQLLAYYQLIFNVNDTR